MRGPKYEPFRLARELELGLLILLIVVLIENHDWVNQVS